MNVDTSQYPIGCVVARFQVHELHEGHHHVIKQVVKNHKKVIIFLGVPQIVGTKKNPLDFDTRKKMVQTDYPDAVIVAIPDNRSDYKWAKELDKRIREVYPHGEVLMYGSRDSFIPYYTNSGGKFQTKELEPFGTFTGTDVRKMISEEVKNSMDFRAGIIYHSYNLYPKTIPTVDIAVMDPLNRKILFCRKYDEDQFRFIGGFVRPEDPHVKASVRRIFRDKAGNGSELQGFEYLDSVRIDDWRFKSEEDKIMTQFFMCSISWGLVNPEDDIAELTWIDIDEKWMREKVCPEHQVLVEILLNKLNEKNITQNQSSGGK